MLGGNNAMNKKLLLLFFGFNATSLLLLLTWAGYGYLQNAENKQVTESKKQLAKTMLITDFCLSTESRHVRHLSTPEYLAPFQDFPAYHEHFPSSSFLQVIVKEK